MHQFTHKKIPNIFCQYLTYSNDIFNYATRNSVNYNLCLPQFFCYRTQRSIKYEGAEISNNIPGRFKQFSHPKFNFFYKQYLSEKYG